MPSPAGCATARRMPFSPAWGLGLDLDPRDTLLRKANLLGRRPREVEVPALHIRAAVINLHQDRLAGGQIGHFGLRAQWQRPMSGGQGVLIEPLATCRLVAVEAWPIPGGRADLNDRRWACGSGLLTDLGKRRRRHGRVVLTTSRETPQPDEADDTPHVSSICLSAMAASSLVLYSLRKQN